MPQRLGEAGNGRITRLQRHHGEGMAPKFRDARRQTGHHLHGNRIDLYHSRIVSRSAGTHVFPLALPADQIRTVFSARTRLRNGGDGRAQVGAQILFAVGVDDSLMADTQVQEVNGPLAVPPIENGSDLTRPSGVHAAEPGERDGPVIAAPRTGVDGEHGDVRAPGHTVGGRSQGPGSQTPAARLATAVPWENTIAGLVGCAVQELLGDYLAGEHRMILIDAGVDEPDGHPGARLGSLPLQQFDVGVRPVGIDRTQTPLVVKTQVVIAVRQSKLRRLGLKIPNRQATVFVGLDAGRWWWWWRRRRRRRWRRRLAEVAEAAEVAEVVVAVVMAVMAALALAQAVLSLVWAQAAPAPVSLSPLPLHHHHSR